MNCTLALIRTHFPLHKNKEIASYVLDTFSLCHTVLKILVLMVLLWWLDNEDWTYSMMRTVVTYAAQKCPASNKLD